MSVRQNPCPNSYEEIYKGKVWTIRCMILQSFNLIKDMKFYLSHPLSLKGAGFCLPLNPRFCDWHFQELLRETSRRP